MRFRLLLPVLVFAVVFIIPSTAFAQTIPFFGPIVPDSINLCPANFAMFMDIINRIILFAITMVLVLVAPLMTAYAGFLLVVNPFNSGAKETAKKIMLNMVIGIVVALAGWLIVDAVMVVLTPNNGKPFGTRWSEMITSGGQPPCLIQAGALLQLKQGQVTGSNAAGELITTGGVVTGPLAQCSASNAACSSSALQSAGFSATQANVMSCIAITESSGIPNTPPYNIAHPGSNSTACGTFQITQTTWNKNASGACSDFSNCTNASCNVQVAKTLVSKNGYKDWTCLNCNSKAQSCISQYGK